MNLVEKAFSQLYPGKELTYSTSLKYSAKFKSYNANLKRTGNNIQLNLSRDWLKVDDEIVIGLLQDLLMRVYKQKRSTQNIELYHTFIKKLHIAIPKTLSNPLLEDSFSRINEKYFNGLVDRTNLAFGSPTTSKLGSYDFHTDTITISSIFRNQDPALLDYIMYHEMIHKKLKFSRRGLKTYHHTSEFKKMENEFENSSAIELRIRKLLRASSMKNFFGLKLP